MLSFFFFFCFFFVFFRFRSWELDVIPSFIRHHGAADCRRYDIVVSLLNEPTHDKTNKMDVRQGKTQISWASAQSDQSSLCAQWVGKDPSFLHADGKLWSNWADAQTDLSSLGAHAIVTVLSCAGSNVSVFNRKRLQSIHFCPTVQRCAE